MQLCRHPYWQQYKIRGHWPEKIPAIGNQSTQFPGTSWRTRRYIQALATYSYTTLAPANVKTMTPALAPLPTRLGTVCVMPSSRVVVDDGFSEGSSNEIGYLSA